MQVKPLSLTWKNLNASVKDKPILHDATGYCRSGEMLAIMGPSGSGKTTILSLLSHKTDPIITVSGTIAANNTSFTAEEFFHFGAFIYQNDLLYQTLTVRETLMLVAQLKYKDSNQAQKVTNELITEFQLQKCADSLVGGQFAKQISGGEKKRVCIAVEMVYKPSLLILDEPTSGLDSHKAGRVLKTLKKLASQGHTVIFTIHQPSYLLYSMLDRLVLLNNGETIYQGEASRIEKYLLSLQITPSPHSTICDFFMMEISEYKKNKDQYTTSFNLKNYQQSIAPVVDQEIEKLQSAVKTGYSKIDYNNSFLRMFSLLLTREFLNYKRNPMKFYGMIGNSLITVIISGLFFLNTIPSTEDILAIGATSDPEHFTLNLGLEFIQAQGTSFVNITSVIMVGIFSVALAFPLERPIYYKETSSKKYSPSAYFLAKIIIEVSSAVLGTVFYSSIGFWMLGYQKTFNNFLIFVVALVTCTLVGNSIGFFTGALFQDPKKASSMSPLLLLPLMMFSGLYNKLGSIPSWIAWIQYISPFRYGLHILLLNEYGELVVVNGPLSYDYRKDLQINLSIVQNWAVIMSLSVMFYAISFVLLRQLTKKISV